MAEVRSLCVYCGSSNRAAHSYLEAAFALGRLIGRAGIELIYGGGRIGLMGRVADGALVEGGRVTGIIPAYLHDREVAHPAISELLVVGSMHERKQLMAERSDGFLVLPGGFGTLDELFEIVTWRQLGLHDKPIVVIDLDGYWRPLAALFERMATERFIERGELQLIEWIERIEDALPTLAAAPSSQHRLESPRL
ncbi:MAG TPA: TIGR00730 family Rossman fold protein [Aliidongia sp.]|nr:TIGR00730 family Rossman fold protein [Aliidongia sp.]